MTERRLRKQRIFEEVTIYMLHSLKPQQKSQWLCLIFIKIKTIIFRYSKKHKNLHTRCITRSVCIKVIVMCLSYWKDKKWSGIRCNVLKVRQILTILDLNMGGWLFPTGYRYWTFRMYVSQLIELGYILFNELCAFKMTRTYIGIQKSLRPFTFSTYIGTSNIINKKNYDT